MSGDIGLGQSTRPRIGDQVVGRVIMLPGVYNTRFHLRSVVRILEQRLPAFAITVRLWGEALRPLRNLRAHERNRKTAEELARDLVRWRFESGNQPLYLVGYSGGGGIAALAAAALPRGVFIDRLVLVAPAISPSFPIATCVLPHVREFVANYASDKDLQVGWGTRIFGAIDRSMARSAGAVGFACDDPRLLQWRWSKAAIRLGHRGNHLSYLGCRWQRAALLPALDPAVDACLLAARWRQLSAETLAARATEP
jgi:pimeloyl-ACP methyl ester carboxylesterase